MRPIRRYVKPLVCLSLMSVAVWILGCSQSNAEKSNTTNGDQSSKPKDPKDPKASSDKPKDVHAVGNKHEDGNKHSDGNKNTDEIKNAVTNRLEDVKPKPKETNDDAPNPEPEAGSTTGGGTEVPGDDDS